MPGLIRSTGCLPDRAQIREDQFGAASTAYGARVDVQQPIVMLRNQLNQPSCVGQALAACVDAANAAAGNVTPCSAASIWTEARRRQGLIEHFEQGTRIEYGIEGILNRGWQPWGTDDEDNRYEATHLASLDEELYAADTKGRVLSHVRIDPTDLDALDSALSAGQGVAFGIGLRAPFFAFYDGQRDSMVDDVVLGLDHLGGSSNGHAQRIFGRQTVRGRRQYLVQNSWGQTGGCHGLDGTWLPGCFRMDESVIPFIWDMHSLSLKVLP